MKYSLRTILLCAALLSACSGNEVKEKLGLDRSGPDEFRVVSRPPLSVPPQFDLHPPASAGSPQATTTTTNQAESLMLGAPVNKASPSGGQQVATKSSGKSAPSAESQFLKNAGATGADPQVREKLEEDKYVAQQAPENDCSWWDVFCSVKPKPKEPLVNPQGEAQRIQQNQDAGKPVTEGETPQVKAKDTGLLGTIFGY